MSADEREPSTITELKAFAEQKVERSHWLDRELTLSPITGDAGFRQYYRLNTRIPMLAVWAPVETEDSLQFCRVAQFMLSHGVRTPRVIALEPDAGFLIVEDLGDRQLLSELNDRSVDGYYSEALSMLLHQQAAIANDEAAVAIFPEYSEVLLMEELSLFEQWYLTELLGIELSDGECQMLACVKQTLVERALDQGQVVVHRDFHSRNLMVLADESLATIDFQDAVRGPLTYDLVSLLKDCYVRWPNEKVEAWALAYAAMAREAGILDSSCSKSAFLQDFHWMGLQRHIKVLGIFARLHLRDQKSRYLNDLPLVLDYVTDVAEQYEELDELSAFLHARVRPRASQIATDHRG